MEDSLKRKLSRGDLLIGTIITLPSPEIAEIFRSCGFDWLFVDLEHGSLSVGDAQAILQAASPDLPCAVRVPASDEAWMKRVLDIGSAGIIVPMVRTAEEVEKSVRLCKYTPEGIRSVGIARAHGYGRNFHEYVASANDETAVIVQIEHVDAVNDIENILEVPGIDCLFVGPYDLSASMGKTGLTTYPEVQAAISHVRDCAERAKMPLGIFGATTDVVEPYIRSGYTLIAVSMDTMLIGNAAGKITDSLK